MSAEDVDELTSDIAKTKKVLGAAIASAAGLEASEVTVTKVWVNGERKFRRLEGEDVAGSSSIDVEFQIVSAKPPATTLEASELGAAIESEAKAEGIEVKVKSVESSIAIVSSPPAPPAPAKPDEGSNFAAIFLTVLAVCVVTLGMIGGFVYWYYKYSASMKAAQDAGAGESHMV